MKWTKFFFLFFFFGFPNIYFLDSRFLTVQSRAICLQSPIFLLLFSLCVCVYNTVLKALCSWLSSERLPIASESTTPSRTHHLAPWDYLLVKALHAQSQSDMTLRGKSWVWHFGEWASREERNTVWQVRCVLQLSEATCKGRVAQEGPEKQEFLISRVLRQWLA